MKNRTTSEEVDAMIAKVENLAKSQNISLSRACQQLNVQYTRFMSAKVRRKKVSTPKAPRKEKQPQMTSFTIPERKGFMMVMIGDSEDVRRALDSAARARD